MAVSGASSAPRGDHSRGPGPGVAVETERPKDGAGVQQFDFRPAQETFLIDVAQATPPICPLTGCAGAFGAPPFSRSAQGQTGFQPAHQGGFWGGPPVMPVGIGGENVGGACCSHRLKSAPPPDPPYPAAPSSCCALFGTRLTELVEFQSLCSSALSALLCSPSSPPPPSPGHTLIFPTLPVPLSDCLCCRLSCFVPSSEPPVCRARPCILFPRSTSHRPVAPGSPGCDVCASRGPADRQKTDIQTDCLVARPTAPRPDPRRHRNDARSLLSTLLYR